MENSLFDKFNKLNEEYNSISNKLFGETETIIKSFLKKNNDVLDFTNITNKNYYDFNNANPYQLESIELIDNEIEMTFINDYNETYYTNLYEIRTEDMINIIYDIKTNFSIN